MEPVTEAGFNMEDWPFYWLTRFSGRYLQQMELALKPIGLDVPQWRVLMALRDRERLSVSEIADHAISKLPTMTKIIKRMTADGLVSCSPRANDQRVTEVRLTESGKVASRAAWDAANRIYARTFEGVSAKEVASLNRIMRTITRNIVQ
ncbi:MarR family transcriptional regulator [Novosphingobium sp. YJ-S2-02]|uniref:MarR family transcriptional regulator n=1 Tax=Novosphingobium aureum TaxID=2792964 RepID=A0A931H9L7_9SPHN|nr:MarR family transcriptional regulator [Novosphingobium aureum]MBH0111885.1 MarR family transcriptional regulator [Novosphingobium aureum]